jgi:hypothetical protein
MGHVQTRDGLCLIYPMHQDSVPPAKLLLDYGARWPNMAVENWFSIIG